MSKTMFSSGRSSGRICVSGHRVVSIASLLLVAALLAGACAMLSGAPGFAPRAWAEDADGTWSGIRTVAPWARAGDASIAGDGTSDALLAEGDIVAQGESGTCTWIIDSDGLLTIKPTDGESGTLGWWDWETPWCSFGYSVTSVHVEPGVKAQTCYRMFNECWNLSSADVSNLDFSASPIMNCMFPGSSTLASLTLPGGVDFSDANIADGAWYGSGGGAFATTAAMTSDNAAKAEGTANTYARGCKVSFDTDGRGTAPETQVVRSGECATEPEAPSAEGWIFQGWYRSPYIDGSSAWDFSTPVTEDTALCARWEKDGTPRDEGVCGTCSWTVDADGLLTIRPSDGESGVLGDSYDNSTWRRTASYIKSVKVEPGVNAQTCSGMFGNCSSLVSVDLSGLDTRSVTWEWGFSYMFGGCTSLSSLDVSNLHFASGSNPSSMFANCPLNELVLPTGVNFSNAGIWEVPWYDASGKTFATAAGMVKDCASKEKGAASTYWRACRAVFDANGRGTAPADQVLKPGDCAVQPADPTAKGWVFLGWYLNGELWDFSQPVTQEEPVTRDAAFIARWEKDGTCCDEGTSGSCTWSIDEGGVLAIRPANGTSGVLGDWSIEGGLAPWSRSAHDIERVEVAPGVKARTCSLMFADCDSLVSVDLSGLDTSAVSCMSGMFQGCSALRTVSLSGLDTGKVQDFFALFDRCYSLESVGLSGLSTASASDLNSMFEGCFSLKSADLSGFDTSNVESMDSLFCNCLALTAVDLSGFDTSRTISMSHMFDGCSALSSVTGISSFATSKVTDMSGMFKGCTALAALDLSGFDTSQVKTMECMLSGVRPMTLTLMAGADFTQSGLANAAWTGSDGTSYPHTAKMLAANDVKEPGTAVSYASAAAARVSVTFEANGHGTSPDAQKTTAGMRAARPDDPTEAGWAVTGWYADPDCTGDAWDFDNLVEADMTLWAKWEALPDGMLAKGTSGSCVWSIDAQGLLTLAPAAGDLGVLADWTAEYPDNAPWYPYRSSITSAAVAGTVRVPTCSNMFRDCTALASVDLAGLDTAGVDDLSYMFAGCSSLRSVDLSPLCVAQVEDMTYMFQGCSSLSALDVSPLGASQAKRLRGMFAGCSGLASLDLSGFDASLATTTACMFQDCSGLASLDLSGFDTGRVADMGQMFAGCTSLASLDVSMFSTAKVTSMKGMFQNCASLTALTLSSFDTAKATTMANMFKGCSGLVELDLSSFDTAGVTDMSGMFRGCTALESVDLSSFDTSNATEMDYMFSRCSSLSTLDLSGFDVSNVCAMGMMLYGCYGLNSITMASGADFAGSDLREAGWTGSDGAKYANTAKMIDGNEAKARGTEVTYTDTTVFVTYDAQGHGSSPAAEQLASGMAAAEPEALQEEGLVFEGWYADADCTGDAWDFESPVLTDTKLYAKWSYDMSGVSFRDARFTYDGKSHSLAITGTLPAGVWATYSGNGCVVAGTYEVTVEFFAFGLHAPIKPMKATMVIDPAPLTVKTDSASRAFDGTALTAGGKLSGLVNGETAELVCTGSQTDAGKTDNDYRIDWGTAKAENYSVASEDIGVLEVTKAKPVLSFAEARVEKTEGDAAFTNALTAVTDGEVAYSGSDAVVATVDAKTGEVSPKAAGTVVVTANAAEGANYLAGSASYELVVKAKEASPDPSPSPVEPDPSPVPAPEAGGTQVAGAGRYDTAAQIALKAYPDGADGVIVATGANFPDALGASSLAGLLGYPVVLTEPGALPDAVASAIGELGAREAIVVGGYSAVSADVESALRGLGCAVSRISGGDRYETARAIYAEGARRGTWGDDCIVATGRNYPDALSVSGYAFANGAPIFLSDPEGGLDGQTRALIEGGGFSRAVVVGGESAVPASVESWLAGACGTAERLAGAGRYETSREIAEFVIRNGGTAQGACVATGENFPDALAGSALAGIRNSVMLLASPANTGALSVLRDNASKVTGIYFLGGDAAVPESVRAAARDAAGL